MPKGIFERHPHTEKAKRKMSLAKKGKKASKETKKKMSKNSATKGRYREFAISWKGGQITNNGYILIYQPSHPFARGNGYIKRGRLVIEKHLGRYLTLKEVIHHRNEIRDDDRIENLKLFANQSKHRKFHCS